MEKRKPHHDGAVECHECGAEMLRDVRPDAVVHKQAKASFEQPGWYCTGCDEVVLDASDAALAEEAFVRLEADVDGLGEPPNGQPTAAPRPPSGAG